MRKLIVKKIKKQNEAEEEFRIKRPRIDSKIVSYPFESLKEIIRYQKKNNCAIEIYFPPIPPEDDYINKLPNEILEIIFIYILFEPNEYYDEDNLEIFDETYRALVTTCKKWYNIIIGSNQIWKRIFIIEILRNKIFIKYYFPPKEINWIKRHQKFYIDKEQFQIIVIKFNIKNKKLFDEKKLKKCDDILSSFGTNHIDRIYQYMKNITGKTWYEFIQKLRVYQTYYVIFYNKDKLGNVRTKKKLSSFSPQMNSNYCIHKIVCTMDINTIRRANMAAKEQHKNAVDGVCKYHKLKLEKYIKNFKY